MVHRSVRIAAGLGAFLLAAGLTACAGEPESLGSGKLPTMAPEQTVAEACSASGDAVSRLVQEAQESLTSGLAAAGQELLSGTMPSLDFLATPLGDTLAQVQQQVTNPEVSAALTQAKDALDGLAGTRPPTSIGDAVTLLRALGDQVQDLTEAGTAFTRLCAKP